MATEETIKGIVIDTETTGLNPERDELLQVSIIDTDGRTLFDSYFKPLASSWQEAERINGISPEMVNGCPAISEKIEEINAIMQRTEVIIGYNTQFDLRFLCNNGLVFPGGAEVVDVMEQFAQGYGEWNEYYECYKWQKLTTAAAYYGYDWNSRPEGAHNSLADCYATLFVYNKLEELRDKKIEEEKKTSSVYDFDQDNILVSGQDMEQNRGGMGEAIHLSQKAEQTYEIYQLRDLHHGGSDEELFMGLDYLRKKGINSPDPRKYDYVYGGRIDDLVGAHNAIQNEWLLEMIFQKLNVGEKPEGYFGRSLSVSDIVVLNQSGERKAYFVDRIGFKELPEFVHEHERETCIADTGIKAAKKTAKKRKGR